MTSWTNSKKYIGQESQVYDKDMSYDTYYQYDGLLDTQWQDRNKNSTVWSNNIKLPIWLTTEASEYILTESGDRILLDNGGVVNTIWSNLTKH